MAKKRFYLIKRRDRRSEGKAIFYCRFRSTSGNLLPWKSTGQITKTGAENWAIDHLNDVASVRETLTFRQYAKGWWLPDCQYLIRKSARGSPVAPSYADVAKSYLPRHILLRFGSERLGGITSRSIDAWALHLKDQLSPATANRCLAVLRVMLREAERQGLIASNPASAVQQLQETPRERGILRKQMKVEFTPESLPRAIRSLFELNNFEVNGPLQVHGAEIDLRAVSKSDPFARPIYDLFILKQQSNMYRMTSTAKT